ncbi:MAG: ATP-binding protein [bacterium]
MKESDHIKPATRPLAARGASIRLRLLALVIAAALPPVIFSVVQVMRADRQARTNAEESALQMARRIATRVDDHISVVDASLLTLSRIVRTDGVGIATNDSILAAVSRELGPRFRQVLVADTLGNVIGLSSVASKLSVQDRRYFREALHGTGVAVGDPVIGRISHEYTIGIGRAVLGADGRAHGVVAASTSLSQLRKLLIPSDLPPGAVVTLLDEHGVVLVRSSEPEKWIGKNISALSSTLTTISERDGVREVVGVDGVKRLSGFATAARAPWHVYVGIPSDIALLKVNAQKREAFALGIGSLLVTLGIAWIIARRIAKPVLLLIEDADAFASGNLAHRSNVDADGELGQLAATFNRMAVALQRRSDELTDSEHRYRILFDTLPLPMWVYDVHTLKFTAVNQCAIDRYGYSREAFFEMSVPDLHPVSEATAIAERCRGRERERATRVSYNHRSSSGEIIDVEVSSDELLMGEQRARLIVAVDVTERNRTALALHASQEQLRQSQKMEAVGSLAGGIAHDFNNLLTAILGYCDLALESAESESQVSEDVLEIRRAAQRAAELTHQLLAFSRRQVLKPAVFGLNSAVRGTDRILRRLISESISLELSLADASLLVRADPAQLEQVILNLAVNARDAMPRGGRLVLATSESTFARSQMVSGGSLPPGSYATLSVVDTGAGITPEVRERLFEPFFTTKERGHGTGLGLATVYGIVQQSGGGIDVQSIPGEGSTFTVYFPIAPEQEPSLVVNPRQETSARGEGTILLAEDDDAVRAIARATLERAGYSVIAATDGLNALALSDAHAGRIDLLLTDVIMPGMNGRELAERMTLLRPGLPVLFVSGYTDNVLADIGIPSTDTALLDKPFTPASLTAAVATILGAERAVVVG